MTYFKTKLDANHGSITKYLRARGVEVIDLSAAKRLPDTLCIYRNWAAFIELKIEGSAAKFTAVQLGVIANTSMPVGFATSSEQAFEIMRDRKVLSQRSKDNIALMLRNSKKAVFTPTEVEGCL